MQGSHINTITLLPHTTTGLINPPGPPGDAAGTTDADSCGFCTRIGWFSSLYNGTLVPSLFTTVSPTTKSLLLSGNYDR